MKCTTPPHSKGHYHFPESGPKSMLAEGRLCFGNFFFCTDSAQLLLSTNWHQAEQSKSPALLPRYSHSYSQASLRYICKASHNFSWKPAIWWARAFSVSCQHKEECAVVQLEKKRLSEVLPLVQNYYHRGHI